MQANPNGSPITPPELVALTESLADTYVLAVADAVNTVQSANPPPEMRARAQALKTFVGTIAYTVATSPNPQVAIIDLVVNISVQRAIYEGGLAERTFGERGAPLVDAYARVDDEAWKTLARVFTPEQLGVLRDGIARWLAANPNQTTVPFIRTPALARYRNVSLVTTPGSIRMLAPVAEAAKAAMELRLLGERSLYLAGRFPYLVSWQSELVLYNALGEPESKEMLRSATVFSASADRLANLLEQLPDMDVAERSLSELKGTLQEATPMLAKLHEVMGEVNQVVGSTDRMLAPFQTQVPGVGGGPPVRTLEVGQYTAALRELGTTVRELNTLLGNTAALVGSPDLAERLRQANAAASNGFGRVGEQGDRWIDRLFWRAVALVAAFFAGLVLYRAAAIAMARRWGPGPRA